VCPSCTTQPMRSTPSSVTVYSESEHCVNFTWGAVDGLTFSSLINNACEEVVHWHRNIFLVPSGKFGTNFVLELAKLYQAYGDNSSLHSIALTACSVMQVLLLQKPHMKSKSKEHSSCLEHHLALWQQGDIASLLKEEKCIQGHLSSSTGHGSTSRNTA